MTSDGRWAVVGTNDGFVHVSAVRDGMHWPQNASWQRLAIRARHQAVTPDGLLIAVCSDGIIWLYSLSDKKWLCLEVGDADLRWVSTSANGGAAAALDVEGRLIWIDLAAVRETLNSPAQSLHTEKKNEKDRKAP